MTVENKADKQHTDKAQAKEARNWASKLNQVRPQSPPEHGRGWFPLGMHQSKAYFLLSLFFLQPSPPGVTDFVLDVRVSCVRQNVTPKQQLFSLLCNSNLSMQTHKLEVTHTHTHTIPHMETSLLIG